MLKKTRTPGTLSPLTTLSIVLLSLVLVLAACSGSGTKQSFFKEENGTKATMILDVDGDYIKKIYSEDKVDLGKMSEMEIAALESTYNAMKESLKKMGIDVNVQKTKTDLTLSYSMDLTDKATIEKIKKMGVFDKNSNTQDPEKLEYKPVEESLLKDGWKKQ